MFPFHSDSIGIPTPHGNLWYSILVTMYLQSILVLHCCISSTATAKLSYSDACCLLCSLIFSSVRKVLFSFSRNISTVIELVARGIQSLWTFGTIVCFLIFSFCVNIKEKYIVYRSLQCRKQNKRLLKYSSSVKCKADYKIRMGLH